jgi:hypothetical protein
LYQHIKKFLGFVLHVEEFENYHKPNKNTGFNPVPLDELTGVSVDGSHWSSFPQTQFQLK